MKIIEKHFTLNKNYSGPDHWFSANPEELANWVKSINNSYLMLPLSLTPTCAKADWKFHTAKYRYFY